MTLSNIFASCVASIAVVILGAIARRMKGILEIRNDFRQFMQEHIWLLTTTLWNRDKVLTIMQKLDMPIDSDPPKDLPERKEL